MNISDSKVERGLALGIIWTIQNILGHLRSHRLEKYIPESEYNRVEEYTSLWVERLKKS